MTPTEKLRKRAIELSNELIGTNYCVADVLEAALIETRNEAFEECAQKLGEIGADNLVGAIRLLKDRK